MSQFLICQRARALFQVMHGKEKIAALICSDQKHFLNLYSVKGWAGLIYVTHVQFREELGAEAL